MSAKKKSFLSSCTSGGCGAKIGPGELTAVLNSLPVVSDKRLLVGFDTSDDAAVFQIDDIHCMISTVDFFSPMVEDPYTFGRIAAANALSDVYAMGGTPAIALNLTCFPEDLELSILGDILRGGAEKIAEANAVVGGGHSIYDKEIKYGLAVTGFIDKKDILRNNTPQIGHCLILTKPLGIGIVMAAARVALASEASSIAAITSMERLNRNAAEKMRNYNVSACTDVTGFGLLIHLLEMCSDTATPAIFPDNLPVLPEAIEYAGEYLLTAAGQRNRNHLGACETVESLPFAMQELLFDPQTSGGLLICVDKEQAPQLLADIQKEDPQARMIGEILPKKEKQIIFYR